MGVIALQSSQQQPGYTANGQGYNQGQQQGHGGHQAMYQAEAAGVPHMDSAAYYFDESAAPMADRSVLGGGYGSAYEQQQRSQQHGASGQYWQQPAQMRTAMAAQGQGTASVQAGYR